MNETRKYHLGDILTVTTGILASPRKMEGLYDILGFMTNDDSLSTVALIRVADEVIPYLLEQHPWLKDIKPEDLEGDDCENKLKGLVIKYGEYHVVRKIHPEDHEDIAPEEDARKLGFTGEVIEVDIIEEDEEPPSLYGNIDWKVDDE